MTRAIRSLNKGRARVWWVHHGQQAIRAAQLTAIVAAWLVVSHFDYQDAFEQERMARQAAEARAAEVEGFSPELPRVTFVLEARHRQDLADRLAEIAGALDRERAEMRSAK